MLVSTSSHVRVGYFARLAQVSHLLGLVLNNKFNPTPDGAFNAQEAQQLRRTLAVYAELLPKEASAADCSHYCGPVAICQRWVNQYRRILAISTDRRSAQLILEQSSFETLSEVEPFHGFSVAAETLSITVVQMAEQLNAELAVTHSELLRPLAVHSIYQVSQIYARQCQRDSDPKYKHGIRVLLQSLSFFEQRWRIAGMLFQYIQVHESEAHLHSRRVQGCDHLSTRAVEHEGMTKLLVLEEEENMGRAHSIPSGNVNDGGETLIESDLPLDKLANKPYRARSFLPRLVHPFLVIYATVRSRSSSNLVATSLVQRKIFDRLGNCEATDRMIEIRNQRALADA